MTLYSLGIEELIARIHINPNIKGYQIKEMIPRLVPSSESIEKEVKSSIYADDTEGIYEPKNPLILFLMNLKVGEKYQVLGWMKIRQKYLPSIAALIVMYKLNLLIV